MPESCVLGAFAFAFGAFCVLCVLRFVRFAFWLRFEECYAIAILRFGCVLKLLCVLVAFFPKETGTLEKGGLDQSSFSFETV